MGNGLSKKARDRLTVCKKDGGLELNLSECEIRGEAKNFKPIWKLPLLIRLNLSRNYIVSIPDLFGQMRDMEEMDISFNSIEELPESVHLMHDLRLLDIRNNRIPSLPAALGDLSRLETLRIGFNEIRTLPDSFSQLRRLQEFDMAGCAQQTLPAGVLELGGSLRRLTLRNNNLGNHIADAITRLRCLEFLDLTENQIAQCPPALGDLAALTELHMASNAMTTLPDTLSRLTNLQVLNVSLNRLEHLGFDPRHMPALRDVNLEQNRLVDFPGGIGMCTSLRNLNLTSNQLRVLPRQVGWLRASLRKLYLANNLLTEVPGELGFLNPALDLNLNNCPLKTPFSVWLAEGPLRLMDNIKPYRGAYPPRCIAQGEHFHQAAVGQPCEFIVKSFDFVGEARVTGGDAFVAAAVYVDDGAGGGVSARGSAREELVVKDNRNGEYSVFYNLTRAGTWELHITSEGEHIQGSPARLRVLGEAVQANHCYVSGAPALAKVNSPVVFTIVARDRFHKPTDGTEVFFVKVTGAGTPVPRTEPAADSTFRVAFVPLEAELCTVSVQLDGRDIEGSPFEVRVSGE